MMKKIIIGAFFLLGLISQTFAQEAIDKAEIELYQSIYGMEKKAVLREYITVKDKYKDTFWKIYDEYEAAREAIGQKRISLLYEYVEKNGNSPDYDLKAAMSEAIKTRKSLSKLQVKYYKKISKEVSTESASQFYQLENYFNSLTNIMVIENLPFIQKKQLQLGYY